MESGKKLGIKKTVHHEAHVPGACWGWASDIAAATLFWIFGFEVSVGRWVSGTGSECSAMRIAAGDGGGMNLFVISYPCIGPCRRWFHSCGRVYGSYDLTPVVARREGVVLLVVAILRRL